MFFNKNNGPKTRNVVSGNLIQTNEILELKREIKLARAQEKVDLLCVLTS
ncbi:MAG TPA: hypothetical protein VFI73_13915 [Candidatus Nitrosopolaris sp.]|nr:hypothetical protein [Candidatus Nitrosopolaris sp.]